MIKLHLFSGFENLALGIKSDTALGHLYSDVNDRAELVQAAESVGLESGYLQGAKQSVLGFLHFDLWGEPLRKAKGLYTVVTDFELYADVRRFCGGM